MMSDNFPDRNEIGEPQLPQNVRSTLGDEHYFFGAEPHQRQSSASPEPVQRYCVSVTPTYVVTGAEHWRRQLSQ